jgi:thiol-disulfide isomerase/thioredoxin
VWLSGLIIPFTLIAYILQKKLAPKANWYNHSLWLLPALAWPFIFYPVDLYPGLSPNERPYETAAFETYATDSIEAISQYNFLFFGSSRCPYCRKLSHKLSSFALKNNLPTKAVLFLTYDDGEPEEWQKFFNVIGSYRWPEQLINAGGLLEITNNKIPLLLVLKNGEVVKAYNYVSFDDKEVKLLLKQPLD